MEAEPSEAAAAAEAPPPEAEEAEPAEADESLAEATLIEPRSGPEAEERAFEEASLDAAEAAAPRNPPKSRRRQRSRRKPPRPRPTLRLSPPKSIGRSLPSPKRRSTISRPTPLRTRKRPARRSPLLTILLIVALVILIAAAIWFLAPQQLMERLGLGGMGSTPLALVTTHMDRQRLESGNELLTVTGRVINPTAKEQSVPPLEAKLKTAAASWSTAGRFPPRRRSLAPGASALQQRGSQRPAGGRGTDHHDRQRRRLIYSNSMRRAGCCRPSTVTVPSRALGAPSLVGESKLNRTPRNDADTGACLHDDGRGLALGAGAEFAAAARAMSQSMTWTITRVVQNGKQGFKHCSILARFGARLTALRAADRFARGRALPVPALPAGSSHDVRSWRNW